MTMRIECPECRRHLQLPEDLAGREVKCPGCGTVWVTDASLALAVCSVEDDQPQDAIQPAQPRRSEEPVAPAPSGPGVPCPHCGALLAPEAVLCIDCGFNRKTGKQLRTVTERFERHWDGGDFPCWGRLVLCGILLAACAAPILIDLTEQAPTDFDLTALGIFLLVIWGLILLPLIGTFKRVTITRDLNGHPLLIRRWWVCLLPVLRSVTLLGEGYKRIRTGTRASLFGRSPLLPTLVLFLLCGILPGLVYLMLTGNRTVVILEIVPNHDGPTLEPILVYRGNNERTMRQIGDTLEAIGGLHYG